MYKNLLEEGHRYLKPEHQHFYIFLQIRNCYTERRKNWPDIGVKTRKTCEKLPLHWLPGKNYCGGHPHNFYIQLFAETGLIGLFFGILMFFSILKTCWDARNKKDPKLTEYIAFVIPLAVFFPIQNHGNFFGQWGNLFLWFGLALAIAENQKWQIKKLT